MNNQYQKLLPLLNSARAGVTGRKVACIVEDLQGNTYAGFNVEKSEAGIDHAETEALKNIPSSSKIIAIHLMGNGGTEQIIPCEDCTKSLEKRAARNTPVFLYNKNSQDVKFFCTLGQLINSYIPLSVRQHIQFDQLKQALLDATPLEKQDANFTYHFVSSFKSHNETKPNESVEMFLTGTASGLGTKCIFSDQIAGKPYQDIDFVLVFGKSYPNNTTHFISEMYRTALSELGHKDFKIELSSKPSYRLEELEKNGDSKDFLFRYEYRVKPETQVSSIDVSVGKNLEAIMTEKYLSKNWLIKLL